MARESAPKLPIPRPSTAHGKPGRRGDGRRPAANRDAPGNPRPGPPAPLPPLPPRGQRLPGAGAGAGRLRAIGEGKLGGGGGRRGAGGCGTRGVLAHLLVPGPRPGVGGCSATRARLGAGLGAAGAGSAAPGARSPHLTGAAAVSAPPLGSGSRARRAARARAGGGVGGGPRLGSAWGSGAPGWLRPRATRPGLRTWRCARPAREESCPAPAGRTPTALTPGAPCRRRPPTRTRTDRHADAHRPGDASPQRATHADLDRHTPTNIGTHAARASVHRHAPLRCFGDPTPHTPFIHVDTGMT